MDTIITSIIKKRAGLLFLSQTSRRILLILENHKWTVPTFVRHDSLLSDAEDILSVYNNGRVLPIELYVSNDKGFEYGTYVCLVRDEFLVTNVNTIAWASIYDLPNSLHTGLKNTLSNPVIQTKIETILDLSEEFNLDQ